MFEVIIMSACKREFIPTFLILILILQLASTVLIVDLGLP
jgi:hypothetical protein